MGYANKKLALRRAILTALERKPRQTAREIAGCVYSRGGVLARPGWVRSVPASQLGATRRALHRLIAAGKVAVCGHRHRWRIFILQRDEPSRLQRLVREGGRREV